MNVMNDIDDGVSLTPADRGFVFAVARRIVGDDEAAADVTQDALLRAFRHRHSFRGDSSYRTWLYRIAVTAALSHLRSRRRHRETDLVGMHDGEAFELDVPAPGPDPEQAVGAAMAADRVRRHLDALHPNYRDVLRLRFEDERSEHEVARALGLSLATVKIRTFRGRRALRAALAA